MKKREEKVSQMMDQLSVAYGDPEVQRMPDLKKAIFNSAQELEKTENVDLVASKLCKKITLNYYVNREHFPEAATVLYNQIKTKEMKYDGTAIAAMLLPIWF